MGDLTPDERIKLIGQGLLIVGVITVLVVAVIFGFWWVAASMTLALVSQGLSYRRRRRRH